VALRTRAFLAGLLLCGIVVFVPRAAARAFQAAPLSIGETFTIDSKVLKETRRINVYSAPSPGRTQDEPRPVLYMPDGGLAEDFLHIAGLLQVSIGNDTMRPFLLVGIENTQRRRDLTGPTDNVEDKKIAPQVGGSATFRTFVRTELMPEITRRYRTTSETAIMGESLAGLFVVETLMLEPSLFDTYIAFDPSVWWNDGDLVKRATRGLQIGDRPKTLFIASSSEDRSNMTHLFVDALQKTPPRNLTWYFAPMPEETHATIYHPAALQALRRLFKP
jgi:predicted alpha/beta superfamily hydrolase